MKTVMHVTEVLSGGVLPVIAGICNGLCDRYKFVVAYGVRMDTPQNLSEIFDDRVKLIPLPSLKLKMSLLGDLKAIKEIRNCVKSENPDIIHIHSTKAGIIARLGVSGKSVKKYYTPHGFCFLRKDQTRLKCLVFKAMESVLAKRCDGIIACGQYEYKEAQKLSSKVFLVENGLDTKLIDTVSEDAKKSDHHYVVYTAGRIGPQKNPGLFNEIASRMPDHKFVWIGDGDEKKSLTSPNITVTGLLSRENVIRQAINYDCYLSTSLWEGLPIALMEAMYLGKKCVVSNVEGNNELIVDGKTGALFSSAEQACSLIMSNEEHGYEAMQAIKEKYTLEKMCEKYERVYG